MVKVYTRKYICNTNTKINLEIIKKRLTSYNKWGGRCGI
ncbi:Uncharacterised protein [Sphingobacterium daejeonense]|nr:Uncharacterised protein [Sphingobacterium daejeonense]